MDSARGRVSLVGAGPGDPGLLTLRAAELLRGAEVLLYDALAAEAIVALAPAACERVFVGKRAGTHAMAQRDIETLAIHRARQGKHVVRLKGGDPFVFGRGGEEAQALAAAGVAFEIVPGISSAIAGPAYAGIPATHRDHCTAVTIATGHEDPSKPNSTLDWEKLADPHRTLVFLMGVEHLRDIARRLMERGLPRETLAAVIADATRPSQRTTTATLGTIADAVERDGIAPPAIAVFGGVVALRDEIRWFDTGPLFGKGVLVTRAGHQSEHFAAALRAVGALPIVAPAISIGPPDDPRPAERSVDDLSSFAWIVFTSRNGVDAFFERLHALRADARYLAGVKIACIGERTAARLRERGIFCDLQPANYVGEEIARGLVQAARPGDRVLVYRAQEARDVLERMLEEAGIASTSVAAYATRVPDDPAFVGKAARADILTFTSASTVRGFVQLHGGAEAAIAAARGKTVACLGPITAQAAADAGLRADVVAESATVDALLAAILSHARTRT